MKAAPKILLCILVLGFVYSNLRTDETNASARYQTGGTWPSDWPAELEQFRVRALTYQLTAGIQSEMFVFALQSREEFEHAWPAILSLLSDGAPLTLRSVDPLGDSRWPDSFAHGQPAIAITTPLANSFVGHPPHIDEAGQKISSERMWFYWSELGGYEMTEEDKAFLDADSIVGEPMLDLDAIKTPNGKWLRPSPPWPDSIRDQNGHLPKYVHPETNDGMKKWVAGRGEGFSYQCRIELELIVDGSIIDLSRIEIPEDVEIIDKRQRVDVDLIDRGRYRDDSATVDREVIEYREKLEMQREPTPVQTLPED